MKRKQKEVEETVRRSSSWIGADKKEQFPNGEIASAERYIDPPGGAWSWYKKEKQRRTDVGERLQKMSAAAAERRNSRDTREKEAIMVGRAKTTPVIPAFCRPPRFYIIINEYETDRVASVCSPGSLSLFKSKHEHAWHTCRDLINPKDLFTTWTASLRGKYRDTMGMEGRVE